MELSTQVSSSVLSLHLLFTLKSQAFHLVVVQAEPSFAVFCYSHLFLGPDVGGLVHNFQVSENPVQVITSNNGLWVLKYAL